MYIIGFVAAYMFFKSSSKSGRLKMSFEQIENLMVYGLIGMILGARLTYVFIYNWGYYQDHITQIPAIWKGGLSFHGALIGIALAVLLFCKRQKIPYLNVTDHICTIVPVGLGFGRIGNFINSELWGRVTDSPLGMVFPNGGPHPRHPSQLYESLGEGWILLGILFFIRRFHPKNGVLTGSFLIGYGVMRFIIEFFREPDSQLGFVLGPFSMGQVLCALMWVVGGIVIAFSLSQKAPAGEKT